VKLGVLDEAAAEMFALTIFLCDGLLKLEFLNPDATEAFRFFTVARKLPIELQMILCCRAVGSMKESILSKDSETAFKDLSRILLQSESTSSVTYILF